MKTVHKSVLLWYSADEMFALVTDIAHYSAFLPWCDQATVLSEDHDGMTAKVGISFAGIKQSFTTRNQHVAGREVAMELVDGPFSQLDGLWTFTPLGEGQRACKVDFTLRYSFANRTLAALVGPVFDKIAGSMVEAFVQRATQVYGES
jgi:ribosome-associated toxin RatA of RatAB toxin-antitoxin module